MNRLFRPVISLGLMLLPALALAHPGHDGPHDFEWDFGHFSAHPVASIIYFGLMAAFTWVAFQYFRSRREAALARQTRR